MDYRITSSLSLLTGTRQQNKNMIDDMKLRYPNVLFIDDNPSNLEEAKYFVTE